MVCDDDGVVRERGNTRQPPEACQLGLNVLGKQDVVVAPSVDVQACQLSQWAQSLHSASVPEIEKRTRF